MVGSYSDTEADRLRRTAGDLRDEVRDLRSQNVTLRTDLDSARWKRKADAMFAVAFLLVATLVTVTIAVASGQARLIATAVSLVPLLVFMPAMLFRWE